MTFINDVSYTLKTFDWPLGGNDKNFFIENKISTEKNRGGELSCYDNQFSL